MNGLMLKQTFLQAVDAASEDMVRLELRKIYDQLDAAALIYVRETRGITRMHTITTVEDQQVYDLPSDFIRLFVRDRRGRFVGKYTYDSGDCTAWPHLVPYDVIYRDNLTDAQEAPACFAVIEEDDVGAAISGTATAAGAVSGGAAVLTDTAAAFSGNVYPRDTVINVARGSSGVVISVTGDTQLVCALFPEGINSWRSGDAYLIQPAARKRVRLDAPSMNAGDTLELPYAAMPAPVYTEAGVWRLDPTACRAIAHEAAFLFSHSDKKMRPVKAHHDIFLDAVRNERYRMAQRALSRGCC